MELITFEEIFGQIKLHFWIFGIRFNDRKTYLRFHLLSIMMILILVAEILYIMTEISSDNLVELADLAPCTFTGILSLLKTLALASKKDMIFDLTGCLEGLYNDAINNKHQKKVIENKVIILSKLLRYYFILNAVLIWIYNLAPPIFMIYHYAAKGEVVYIVPYAVLLPFSTDVWYTWFVVYIYSIICAFLSVLYFVTSDALFCVFTSQICNNFSILSEEILNLNTDNIESLGNIVQRHQYLLKLSKDLDDIYKLPNLFNYLVGSVEICALGFSITMGDWSNLVGYVLFLFSVLLQMLMMSVFGENLIEESRKVGETAYLCNWFEMNQKAKKSLLILMIRSRKQQQLTAYKFSVISYASFSTIISTSWSYFTLLRTVYRPSEY